MSHEQQIRLFEDRKVRIVWDSKQEKWYLSIVDVIQVLTDSANPQVYWRVLNNALQQREIKPLQIVTLSRCKPLTRKCV